MAKHRFPTDANIDFALDHGHLWVFSHFTSGYIQAERVGPTVYYRAGGFSVPIKGQEGTVGFNMILTNQIAPGVKHGRPRFIISTMKP